MLGQEPLGEGVQGADGGAVELVERDPAAVADLGAGAGVGLSLELLADPVAQLGGGLVGEGDGGDVGQLGGSARHQSHHPVDQRGRLARAGAGLDEQRRAEVVGDAVPGAWSGASGSVTVRRLGLMDGSARSA